jgi:hypothetical protein
VSAHLVSLCPWASASPPVRRSASTVDATPVPLITITFQCPRGPPCTHPAVVQAPRRHIARGSIKCSGNAASGKISDWTLWEHVRRRSGGPKPRVSEAELQQLTGLLEKGLEAYGFRETWSELRKCRLRRTRLFYVLPTAVRTCALARGVYPLRDAQAKAPAPSEKSSLLSCIFRSRLPGFGRVRGSGSRR